MIHRTASLCQTPDWQQSLQSAISSVEELCRYLKLEPSELPLSDVAQQQFPLKVPYSYAELIEKNNPYDPLLLQILPTFHELMKTHGFKRDPVGDLARNPAPGIIHKYHGRALLITTGACAIHCRYCFRRHFPYADSGVNRNDWRKSLEYLAAHPEIDEVILSGGDPLVMSDQRLIEMIEDILSTLPELARLRIHTRVPTILPERIASSSLLEHLGKLNPKIVFVTHVNHHKEISDQARLALKIVNDNNVLLLNQSVLLKNVNDHPDSLILLSQKLFEAGVVPYYLHLLDPVEGAAHFEVQKTKARQLHKALLDNLPGYLVPKLVQELPGKRSKQPITGDLLT